MLSFIPQVFLALSTFSAGRGIKGQCPDCIEEGYIKIIDPRTGKCEGCWPCPECQEGAGSSVQCGSTVPKGTDIHCVSCTMGINFSNSLVLKSANLVESVQGSTSMSQLNVPHLVMCNVNVTMDFIKTKQPMNVSHVIPVASQMLMMTSLKNVRKMQKSKRMNNPCSAPLQSLQHPHLYSNQSRSIQL